VRLWRAIGRGAQGYMPDRDVGDVVFKLYITFVADMAPLRAAGVVVNRRSWDRR
jgi:hypothetical protein